MELWEFLAPTASTPRLSEQSERLARPSQRCRIEFVAADSTHAVDLRLTNSLREMEMPSPLPG
jgi:hypothetical protein